MSKSKAYKIIDASIDGKYSIASVFSALYISSKGTKHFYECMELLATVNPEGYKKEFEKLKQLSPSHYAK